MKFLKTLRFDASDGHVFDRAAGPEEWAISGAFAFANLPEARITGKTRQAFANGFLSLDTFGRATFATVTGITEPDLTQLTETLTRHFTQTYGAPTPEDARPAAAQEIDFITGLCAPLPFGAILAVRRRLDDAGQIREEFRVIDRPKDCEHSRAWQIVED